MSQDTILSSDTVKNAFLTKINDDLTELFAIKAEVEAARDGYSSLLAKEEAQDDSISSLTGGGNGSLVSSNDTTPGYLNGKLVAGDGITFTEQNDGGNESLSIASDSKLKVSSNDSTPGYLGSKCSAGDGITITEQNDGSNETVQFALSETYLKSRFLL